MTGPHPSGYDLDSIDLRLDILINARLLIVTLHSGSANGTKVADLAPPVPLVSNLGQTSSATTRGGTLSDLAQQFTTGANPGGYTLTGVELKLSSTTGAGPPTVTLHSGSAHGTKAADFTGPAAVSVGASVETFTPTTAVTLSASTDDWVVIEGGSSDMAWSTTTPRTPGPPGVGPSPTSSRAGPRPPPGVSRTIRPGTLLRIYGRITPPPNAAATGAPTIGVPKVRLAPHLRQDARASGPDGGHQRHRRQQRRHEHRTPRRVHVATVRRRRDDAGGGRHRHRANLQARRRRRRRPGKRIKLSFSFTDDARYAEGALTSAATDAVTAAAACVEPTLTGGATFIE